MSYESVIRTSKHQIYNLTVVPQKIYYLKLIKHTHKACDEKEQHTL